MNTQTHVVDITRENFKEFVVDKSMQCPVMVDFWATWCEPCKTLTPILTKLAEEYRGGFLLAKVNVDENQELAAYFGARSIPTVKIVLNGELVDEFVGAQPESSVREMLDRHIQPGNEERPSTTINSADDLEAAIAQLESSIEKSPEDWSLRKDLAQLRFQQGDHEAAEREINSLPIEEQTSDEIKALVANLFFMDIAQQAASPDILAQNVAANPSDTRSCYQLAAHQVVDGDYQSALERLLAIVQKDRSFEDDAGRKAMIMIFDLLGSGNSLVGQFRRRLLSALH